MQLLVCLHPSCSLKARGSALSDTSLGRAALWIQNLPTHTNTRACICAFRPCSPLQSNSTFLKLHRVKVHLVPNEVCTHRPQRLLRLLCLFQASGTERQSLLQDLKVSPAADETPAPPSHRDPGPKPTAHLGGRAGPARGHPWGCTSLRNEF